MNKYILLFVGVAVIGFFGWRTWNQNHVTKQVGFDFSHTQPTPPPKTMEETFKDKSLHNAFAKILAKEKSAKKKKNRTIDELIQYNLETGSTDMSKEERALVIEKLQHDVSSFGGVITALYAADESEKAADFEHKLEQKREQLENFRHLDKQLSGVTSENN
ncbi:MAG: tetratricopeptide repeat protein [Bdellovibrionales bacterium]|nr:tetratricopeptide repeat protein [Bdellovibrionales bacterium]